MLYGTFQIALHCSLGSVSPVIARFSGCVEVANGSLSETISPSSPPTPYMVQNLRTEGAWDWDWD